MTPAIHQFVNSDQMPKVENILVPGCGVGYDVIELSKNGSHVIGMDLSNYAIQLALKMKSKHAPNNSNVEFIQGDFYTYSPKQKFDMIFDYTFLCAMQLHMRPKWAEKMKELTSPGGYLLTLMYPLSNHQGGPPFSLNQQIYHELLNDSFKLLWDRKCISVEQRDGLERLALWQAK